jgi:hypothetical protein
VNSYEGGKLVKQKSAKDGLHNSHVIDYYGLLCRYATHCKRFMAQWFYWSQYHFEIGDFEEAKKASEEDRAWRNR